MRPITTRPQQKIVPQSTARTYNAQDKNRAQESWRTGETINRRDNQISSSHVPAGGPNQTFANQRPFVCVLCHEEGKFQSVRHNTPDCNHLEHERRFSVAEKWEILERNGVCMKCLMMDHVDKDCQKSVEACPNCRLPHKLNPPCKQGQGPPRAYGGQKNRGGR